MEDILASIRRIIADDQSDAPPAPAGARRQAPAQEGQSDDADRRASRESRWRSLDEIEEGGGDEEPLELSEAPPAEPAGRGGARWYDEPEESDAEVRESTYRSYRPAPEEDLAFGGQAPPANEDILELGEADEILDLREEDEVLELTDPVAEDHTGSAAAEIAFETREAGPVGGPVGDEPPLPAAEDQAPFELTADMEITDKVEAGIDAGSTPGPQREGRPTTGATSARTPSQVREGQRGVQPSPAVAQAFSRLRRTMATETDRRQENRAEAAGMQPELQANLEQLLRPMIKEWLDQNLPQAIDRLVREEATRVAKDPEND